MSLVVTPHGPSGAAAQLPPPLRLAAGSLVIGRGPAVDLAIPDPLVSGRHCTIFGEGSAWQIQDSSTNGTTVNGRRIAGAQALRNGDLIGVGSVTLAVAIDAAAGAAAATQAPAAQINLQDWNRAGTPHSAGSHPAPVAPPSGDAVAQLLQAAGIDRRALAGDDAAILAGAGVLLRAAVDGLAGQAAAEAKARRELGVAEAPTANPLADGSGRALERLLAMPTNAAGGAVAEACRGMETHRQATLKAMQAAFAAALDQFAPEAIKLRARDDAAAWRAYEKAFAARDGFVETFARELAAAYAGGSGPGR